MADNNDTGNGVKPTLDPIKPIDKRPKPPIKPDTGGGDTELKPKL